MSRIMNTRNAPHDAVSSQYDVTAIESKVEVLELLRAKVAQEALDSSDRYSVETGKSS